MSTNKHARKKLEELYGAECFIEKLEIRKHDRPRRYTGKGQMKKMKQLTYHHILEKSKGGKATVENGALLSAENHAWFHQQPRDAQRIMNQMFQDYKKHYDECRIEFVDDLEMPFEVKTLIFDLPDKQKSKYNRREKKKEDRELIREYEEER